MTRGSLLTLRRDCRAQPVPQGAPIHLPAGTPVTLVGSQDGWHMVITESRQMLRIAAADSDALGMDPPEESDALGAGLSTPPPVERGQEILAQRPPEESVPPTPEQCSLEEHCLEALRDCYDPELPVNIVDLGLVYLCQVTPLADGGHEVLVLMSLTSPGCGMADILVGDIETKLAKLPGVGRVRVEIVFDPPWDPSRMTEAARLQLGVL